MRRGPFKQALPYKSLAEEKFDVLVRPLFRREGLEEHHDSLEIHLDQLIRPLDQESRTHVKVEL